MNRLWLLIPALLLTVSGCLKEHTSRSQAVDTEVEKDGPKTIGEISSYDNAQPIPVTGVGLVVGLEGTGGGCPPGSTRDFMKAMLKKKGFDNPGAIIDSPNHAVVQVTALIPAGVRRGDPGSPEPARRGGGSGVGPHA